MMGATRLYIHTYVPPLLPGLRDDIYMNNRKILEGKKISKLTCASSSFVPEAIKMRNLKTPSVNYKLFDESSACLLTSYFDTLFYLLNFMLLSFTLLALLTSLTQKLLFAKACQRLLFGKQFQKLFFAKLCQMSYSQKFVKRNCRDKIPEKMRERKIQTNSQKHERELLGTRWNPISGLGGQWEPTSHYII